MIAFVSKINAARMTSEGTSLDLEVDSYGEDDEPFTAFSMEVLRLNLKALLIRIPTATLSNKD
jgi:hypothetical protein